MVDVDHEAVTEFIVEAQERLAWMNEELARLNDESDRRAMVVAREELVRMIKSVVLKETLASRSQRDEGQETMWTFQI